MSLKETIENISNEIASSVNRPNPTVPSQIEAEITEPKDEGDSSGRDDRDDNDKKRYKYVSRGQMQCCRKCKHTQKGRKACVCVVPLSQRRTQLGEGGCQTCSCIGCSVQDFISRGEDPEYKPNEKIPQENSQRFQARNGCCRRCMKAFSKTNKACLCQVPRDVRKNELSSMGCKYCGCTGCNPQDKKGEDRSRSSEDEQKRGERRYVYSSDSEQSQIINPQQYNLQNFDKSAIGNIINNEYRLYGPMVGFGIPQRSYSYILGKPRR